MEAIGLLIPMTLIALFWAAARMLRACGLRPDEEFAIPRPQRVTTISE